MNITIRTIDARTFQVSINEHAEDAKLQDKPTITQTGGCLEIVGKQESNGNKIKICMHTGSIAGFVVEETEQYGVISLFLHNMNIIIKYVYYKVTGDLSKVINHKFKEDRELLECILEQNTAIK